MIWLIGDPDDLSGAYLGWLAEERGVDVVALREDALGLDWTFALAPDGRLDVRHGDRDVSTPTGAIVRLNPQPAVREALGIDERLHPAYVAERRAALAYLLDHVGFPVVNPPTRGRENGSKPLQMTQLAAVGFAVPEWLATNEPAAAAAFAARRPDGCIAKAVSGLRSHVRMYDEQHLARLSEGSAPLLIQQYVAGHDVRVHVVGDRVFGNQVRADVVDYRFDTEHAEYTATPVPDDVARLSVTAAADAGLLLAGLDFRVDADGSWWCLEMNPVPTFLPYEAATGHRIGDAVVDLLCPGVPSTETTSPIADRLALAFAELAR